MMSSDFYFRSKIPVAILGATQSIGQKFVHLLAHHPWFEIAALSDSEHLVGKLYGNVAHPHRFDMPPLPESVMNMAIQSCEPSFPCSLIFSGIDPSSAVPIETQFAHKGYTVVSHSPYPREMHVPAIIPEVNSDHLAIIEKQPFPKGRIVTTSTSGASGIVLALKPLLDQFGIDSVQVVLEQPFSQTENQQDSTISDKSFIPWNQGEEIRLEQEVLHILGKLQGGAIQDAKFQITIKGTYKSQIENDHALITVKLTDRAKPEQIIQSWQKFAEESRLQLPYASFHPLYYFDQPSHIRINDIHMLVTISNLSPSSILDYQFDTQSVARMQEIGYTSLLNAELLVTSGNIYW